MADELLKIDGNERSSAGGLERLTLELKNFRMKECEFADGTVQALAIIPVYYNALSGLHEWGQKPQIEIEDLTVSMGDVEKLLAKSYWKDIRFAYASATVTYIGRSTTHKASTSTGNLWHIWKITKNASGQVERIEGPLNDDWDDRASLSWGV